MLQLPQAFFILLALAASASAAAIKPAAAPNKSVKREISDVRLSSPYTNFPLSVTETLGTGALTNLGYPGSLGNIYARDDEFYGGPGYYEYPQYAAGYGNYRTYGYYNDFGDSLLGLSGYPYGIGSLAGYPYYPRSGLLARPAAFYAGRLGGYYD